MGKGNWGRRLWVQGSIAGLFALAGGLGAAHPGLAQGSHTTAVLGYLDQLAGCEPSNHLLPMPMFTGLLVATRIEGWQQGRCKVDNQVFAPSVPEARVHLHTCHYQSNTLQIMTDEVAYEQVRTGTMTFDTSNSRDMQLSQALGEECDFNRNWLEQLLEHLPQP